MKQFKNSHFSCKTRLLVSGKLCKDDNWKKASVKARIFYEYILRVLRGRGFPLGIVEKLLSRTYSDRADFMTIEGIFSRIYPAEVYDEAAVVLEIKIKKSGGKDKKIEASFNKSGEMTSANVA